ncbi:MAG: hypothetical protein AAFR93_03940, partial [Pseudomonadota bacterium]
MTKLFISAGLMGLAGALGACSSSNDDVARTASEQQQDQRVVATPANDTVAKQLNSGTTYTAQSGAELSL